MLRSLHSSDQTRILLLPSDAAAAAADESKTRWKQEIEKAEDAFSTCPFENKNRKQGKRIREEQAERESRFCGSIGC